jgi:hypothetical protein
MPEILYERGLDAGCEILKYKMLDTRYRIGYNAERFLSFPLIN